MTSTASPSCTGNRWALRGKEQPFPGSQGRGKFSALPVTGEYRNMKQVIAVLLGLVILGISGWRTAALAEDAQASRGKVPAFYNWLEKYQNPTPQLGSRSPSQPVSAAAQPQESVESRQHASAAEPPSPPVEAPPLLMGGATETAEPGEGLGCFYHRAYYSHLPLFKNGAYTLPGSLDVAEPYQKPSQSVFAPSAAPPR
jgi:hypothetical protein